MIDALVRGLSRANPDVSAAIVVDADGRVHASDSASSELVASAVAFAVPLRELLDRSVAELGGGALMHSLIEGSDGTFALADIDGFRTVVLIGAPGSAPGSLRSDARWLAEQLRASGDMS